MPDKIEQDIKKFFQGREASFRLFRLLRQLIEKNCSPKMKVSKTQVSFGEDYKYLWVWLPQMWVGKRPEESITLTIVTGEKLNNKRIVESVSPRKGFWTHHILIDHPKDINQGIEDLIKASYRFYLKRKELKNRKVQLKKGTPPGLEK